MLYEHCRFKDINVYKKCVCNSPCVCMSQNISYTSQLKTLIAISQHQLLLSVPTPVTQKQDFFKITSLQDRISLLIIR